MYAADAVATALAGTIPLLAPATGSVVLTYAAGGNLLVGPVRPQEGVVPQVAVFVLQTGGAMPLPYLGQRESFHASRVQVTVRASVDAFLQGEGLARALHARAHLADLAGAIYCKALESEPVYLGSDENDAHRFVFNLEVGARR